MRHFVFSILALALVVTDPHAENSTAFLNALSIGANGRGEVPFSVQRRIPMLQPSTPTALRAIIPPALTPQFLPSKFARR